MTEPRSWELYAGAVHTNVGLRLHVASHPRTVQMYGDIPEPVTALEDPEGPYYGWLYTDHEASGPVMIQPRESLFKMQFTYGYQAEVDNGRGTVVRLQIEPREEQP